MKISKNFMVGLIPIIGLSTLLSFKVYPTAPLWVSILAFAVLCMVAVVIGFVAADMDARGRGLK